MRRLRLIDDTEGIFMKPLYIARAAAATLILCLPFGAYSAETESSKSAAENPALTSDDLATIGERIRQTGAQME